MALVEEELEDADLSKQELKQYSQPLNQYININLLKLSWAVRSSMAVKE
ncbi:MAG: hypothetical protein F6K55_39650 [Moorea sp. SIO4A3]|nr:hypothetical protein [Moorena sp. SIO4A3]